MKNFKVLALAMVAVMGMTFTACDKNDGEDNPSGPSSNCKTAKVTIDVWLSDSALGLFNCGIAYTDGQSDELKMVHITAANAKKGVSSFLPIDTDLGYPQPKELNHYRLTLPTIALPGSFKYRFDFSHKEAADMSYVVDNKATFSNYCECTVTFDNGNAVPKFEPQHRTIRNYESYKSNNLNSLSVGSSISLATDATVSREYFSR